MSNTKTTEVPYAVEHNESDYTPIYDRVQRKLLRAELHKYPDFKKPMPHAKHWDREVSLDAYHANMKGWIALFEHHKRELEQKSIADAKKIGVGTAFSAGSFIGEKLQTEKVTIKAPTVVSKIDIDEQLKPSKETVEKETARKLEKLKKHFTI